MLLMDRLVAPARQLWFSWQRLGSALSAANTDADRIAGPRHTKHARGSSSGTAPASGRPPLAWKGAPKARA